MSSAEADDSEYGDIKVFFTASEWKELTIEEKKSHRKSKDNYEAIRRCGWTTRPPFFMCRKLPAPERQQLPQQQDETSGEAAAFPSVLDHAEEHGRPPRPSPDLPREGASHGPRISEPSTPGLSNPGLSTPGLSNPGLSTPGLSTPGLSTPGLSTPGLSTPGLSTREVSTPGLSTPGLSTPGLSTPRLSTPRLSTPGLSTPALSTPEAMALRTVRRAVSQKTPEPELHVAAVHFAAHEPRTSAAPRHPKRAVRSKTHEPGPQDHVSLGTAPEPRTSEPKGTSGASTFAATRFAKRSVGIDTHKETELQDEASLSAAAAPPLAGAAGARGEQAQDEEARGQQDAAGEAPHRCATCGAAFRRAALLRAHMRTHAADKLDSGEHCGDSPADGAGHRMHATHTRDALGARKLRILDSKQTSETWAAAAPRLPKSVVSRTTHKVPGLLSDAFLSAVAPPPLAGAAGARGQQAQHGTAASRTVPGRRPPHRCATCGAAFRRAALLQAHIRTHAADKLDSGEHCSDSSSADNADLRRHAGTHTDDRPFRCLTCGKGFTRSTILRKHMMTHTGEKPYKCRTCGKRFAHHTSLRGHMMTHTGEKPFSCQTCGKHFSESSNLRKHARIHTGEKPYSCQTCGKHFSERGKLRKHARIHTGEKPYSCQTCGKHFSESGNLRRHARIHTGEKPYSCQTCGKHFSESSHLRKHARTHTGEKPYSCQTCGKHFSERGNLRKHVRIHTGEKPFSPRLAAKNSTKESI